MIGDRNNHDDELSCTDLEFCPAEEVRRELDDGEEGAVRWVAYNSDYLFNIGKEYEDEEDMYPTITVVYI